MVGNIRLMHPDTAQFFYVGAQTVCWTYLMHYGHHVFYDLEGLAPTGLNACAKLRRRVPVDSDPMA